VSLDDIEVDVQDVDLIIKTTHNQWLLNAVKKVLKNLIHSAIEDYVTLLLRRDLVLTIGALLVSLGGLTLFVESICFHRKCQPDLGRGY
jgi:hypothetical protein